MTTFAAPFLVPCAGLLALSAAQAVVPSQDPVSPQAAPLASAVTWSDYDGDGRLDALSTSPEGLLRLLASRAEAGFEDVTQAAGLAELDSVALALWGDYDGDGRADLFVARRAGASLLLHSEGESFVDMAAGAGLVIEEPVLDAHWLDEDGDGRLDLHAVTSTSNQVWRGLEGGFFEPVALPLEVGASMPGLTGGALASPASTGPASTEGAGGTAAAGSLPGRPALPDEAGSALGSSGPRPLVVRPETPGGSAPLLAFPTGCTNSIRDQANPGSCLQASSEATLGMLYPLSSKLFVSEATGRVGIGTTTPSYPLHVNGKIVSGTLNNATGLSAAVGGGELNFALGESDVIGGGYRNATTSSGSANVIAGGQDHNISGSLANHNVISGGRENRVAGIATAASTIGGGELNLVNASRGTIPGGSSNLAAGADSFAAGTRAKATHSGAFVWGDGTAFDKPSSADDEFNVYAEGGLRVFAAGVATPSMVVDPAGSVGVGTPTPAEALHVEGKVRSAGANGGQFTIFNPNNQGASAHFSWLNDVARFRIGGGGPGANSGFDFQRIGDQSLMRLLDNGNVGIGTTTPGFDLEVNGTAAKPGGGSWSVSSDARLKKGVEDLEGALATLLALRGVSFEYIDPAAIGELDGRRIGFIAQEVERVLPDWVGEKADGTKYLTIRGFEALAVEALRELERRNHELAEDGAAKDARIAELEARLERLELVQDQVEAMEARLVALER